MAAREPDLPAPPLSRNRWSHYSESFFAHGSLDAERGRVTSGSSTPAGDPAAANAIGGGHRGWFEIADCLPVEARELLATSRSVLAAQPDVHHAGFRRTPGQDDRRAAPQPG
jgi:hypothetical protein